MKKLPSIFLKLYPISLLHQIPPSQSSKKLDVEMNSDSHIELIEKNLTHNIQMIRRIVGKTTKLSSVVKGNAYGHGFVPFLEMSLANGIDHFAVANAREARQIAPILEGKASIMVMGIYGEQDVEWFIQNEIEFYIGSLNQLKLVIQKAKVVGKKAKVHLEIETGLNRLGLEEQILPVLADLILSHPNEITIMGVCSQLSGVEKPGNEQRVESQYRNFDRILAGLRQAGLNPYYTHIDSSISTLTCFRAEHNMVRIGTAQYGIYVNYHDNIQKKGNIQAQLKRVMIWKSKVYSIREVASGGQIGYGMTQDDDQTKRIAVLPVGYFDGYRRHMPEKSHVLIKGKKAPIVGLVSMNSCCVDITDIKDVEIGDEVILLGGTGTLKVDPESFFPKHHYVNGIELPSGIHSDVPRIIKKN